MIRDRIVATMNERIGSYGSGEDAPVNDEFDRHVHAAAVAGQIDSLVTSDRGFLDLSEETKDELPYEIYSPDEFFVLVDDSMPHAVCAVLQRMIAHSQRLERPKRFDDSLTQNSCPTFAERVRAHWTDLLR